MRRLPIRLRLTAAFALAMAAVLAATGLFLFVRLGSSLDGTIDSGLRSRSAEVSALVRGGGDLLGKRQSGLPGFRLADPAQHEGLLQMANRDAAVLLDRDPKLESVRGMAVRRLLRLFGRGPALRTLTSG